MIRAGCDFCGKTKDDCVVIHPRNFRIVYSACSGDSWRIWAFICRDCLKDMKELYNGSEGV